eukprot:GHVR01130813.1.p1 GENE.GHVR01130813.1~~GHVR01130813.1.p1  ORF type:complete len:186 (+),score=4.03 GHVR01130813.1:267-824(+)
MFHRFRQTPKISNSDWVAAVEFATSGSLFPDSEFHGEDHWRAVATQGLRLAEICDLGRPGRITAALFGLFHDCRRISDGWDPDHGTRGAQALVQCPSMAGLPALYRRILVDSINKHDSGETTSNPLTGLGWDADRSVLTRVGITPCISFFSVVPYDHFDQLIQDGFTSTRNPLSWDQIYKRAVAP